MNESLNTKKENGAENTATTTPETAPVTPEAKFDEALKEENKLVGKLDERKSEYQHVIDKKSNGTDAVIGKIAKIGGILLVAAGGTLSATGLAPIGIPLIVFGVASFAGSYAK